MPSANLEQLCAHAVGLLTNGDAAGAAQEFERVLIADPNYGIAWANRGVALMKLGHPFDAVLNIDRAIDLSPDTPEWHNNRGAALFDMEMPDQAIESYLKAYEFNPDIPETLMNLGNAYKFKGQMEKARVFYRLSIEAKADYGDGHLCLAHADLALGDYVEGWKEFEWRWKTQLPPRGLQIPAWEGEDIRGKTLLIYAEQGHGDTLQFIRYAPIVKQKYGCKVIVEVRHPLTRLISSSFTGIDGVITFGDKVPKVDYMVAMMSLPRILGTTLETIPWPGPYFKPDQSRVDAWQKRLKVLPPGLRVGICWAGMSRPGMPAADAVDRKRSTTLASFAEVALTPGVSWVSLQKGPAADQVQRPPRGMTILDCSEDIDDFYDTAALIECLDLVISVDTAVLHLAAAMGKPTWLLSRWDGCWRWLGAREDSPWYPTLRQFTQPKPNDWASMLSDVAVELRKMVPQRKVA